MMSNLIGKKVLVRGEKSGVEFGEVVECNSWATELKNARRIWYWEGAASLSQLAKDGTALPESCKFTVSIDSIIILDVVEIIPCTDKAIESIESVKEWKFEA